MNPRWRWFQGFRGSGIQGFKLSDKMVAHNNNNNNNNYYDWIERFAYVTFNERNDKTVW